MTAKSDIITIIPTIMVGSTTSESHADDRGGTSSSLWLHPMIPEFCPPLPEDCEEE